MMVSGRCPSRLGETLVSVADTAASKTHVGAMLSFPVSVSFGSTSMTRLRVVGLYDPDRSVALDLLRPSSLAGQLAQLSGDPLITTRTQLAALGQGSLITARLRLAGPLDVQEEPAVRATLDQVKAATLGVAGRLVVFDSQLPQLLDDVYRRVASASVLMLVTVVQAEVRAVFALVIALQRLGRSRSAEWGVGRLRGMPWRAWLGSIWAEPSAALLLGLPVGWRVRLASPRSSSVVSCGPGLRWSGCAGRF